MADRAETIARLGAAARKAASARNWPVVAQIARDILALDRQSAEGWFLAGLAEKSAGNPQKGADSLQRALHCDPARYDAAVELAEVLWGTLRHAEAKALLERCEPQLANSPYYLHRAGTIWSRMGLHARALPLFEAANRLQPGIETFQASLAGSAVLMGRVDQARALYRELLEKHPGHQRNHYELSRLARAQDRAHVDEMQAVLEQAALPPEKNIFLYYAIAKELEDLGDWAESFHYYQLGGDAAAAVARAAGYRVDVDLELMEQAAAVCTRQWLDAAAPPVPASDAPTPVFIVGLPRTGTTLTERIIGSHSQVESADESFFLQIAIRRASGVQSREDMTPRMLEYAARAQPATIARHYLDAIGYRLTGKPLFIEKYPLNFLYLGFIARSFPTARIVHLRRNPMDACFAMYKQSFFRFAYTLEDLAAYYVAYDRLNRHWRETLGDRMIEVRYEDLVSEPDAQIRRLLERLDLPFEQACLDFHLNEAPSATASTVQVREKAHTRSVARWKKFENELRPLREKLEAAGIAVD